MCHQSPKHYIEIWHERSFSLHKVKFTIPPFSGHYDAEGYLDWEMTVEQKFSAHLVPERHRVRQASSEFKDFAIIWWSGLVAENALPTT